MALTRAEAEQIFLTNEQARVLYTSMIQATTRSLEEQVLLIRTSHTELSKANADLRAEVDSALKTNKLAADAVVDDMKEELKKYDEKRVLKDSSDTENQDLHNKTFEAKIQSQVEVVNDLTKAVQDWSVKVEVDFTALAQAAQDRITQTQKAIKDLVETHKSTAEASGSGIFRAPAERDRQVFDPRDYKVAELPEKMNLAAFKKWRHDT